MHYSMQPSYHHGRDEQDPDEARAAKQQKQSEIADDAALKIRMFSTMVNNKFRASRNPQHVLCVDETMTPYKGRSTIKVIKTHIYFIHLNSFKIRSNTMYCRCVNRENQKNGGLSTSQCANLEPVSFLTTKFIWARDRKWYSTRTKNPVHCTYHTYTFFYLFGVID
jgi:hypothetical protein